MPKHAVDVAGLGLNATDTVLRVREIPPPGGKERVAELSRQVGGPITTALVACQRLGLRTRYIGTVGDDSSGRLQLRSLRQEGIDVRYARKVPGASTQYGLIVVDQKTGERTVFWDRDKRLALSAREIEREAITSAKALLVDGCDVEACLQAARWARQAGIPVVADLDTAYRKVEKLFPLIDYLFASADFLPAVTGRTDPVLALEFMRREYGVKLSGVTLGRDGALAFDGNRFYYSGGFAVRAVDTTGAGDVFHGAFVYGLLQGWKMERVLDFSCAFAALNCTKLGARGGIASRRAAERLMATGKRHCAARLARLAHLNK